MRAMVVQDAGGNKKPTFSNAELKMLAEYLSGLPGELKTVPQTRFHHPH
jgi:hypothetical protein